jgi:hypothetical protein
MGGDRETTSRREGGSGGGGDNPPHHDDRGLACISLAYLEMRAAEEGRAPPAPPRTPAGAPLIKLGEDGNPSSRTASLMVGDEGRPTEDESAGEPKGEPEAAKAHSSPVEGTGYSPDTNHLVQMWDHI